MPNEEKSEAKLLKEKLFYKQKNGAKERDEAGLTAADAYCEPYKAFLDEAKMEREAVEFAVREAEKKGFVPYQKGQTLKPGDRVYAVNRGKAAVFAIVGEDSLASGVRLTGAHIDSPRLDLKQNPLYEDTELALFKTHYYGGLKKYQWTAIPLALHGVIVRKDGTAVRVRLGEEAGDPLFCVTDLLPHLAKEQMKKPMTEFGAEKLNVLVGSRPFKDDKESELVKLNVLRLLNEKYGIAEADFLSAELCMVPAFKACDIGFDRSLVGAYGHDDRVCAYTSFTALLDVRDVPQQTCVCMLADKEEVGSAGNTGSQSAFLRFFIADLAAAYGLEGRDVLSASRCLSADVNAAFDPTYPDVMEKANASYVNHGVVLSKYTGHGGKYDTSDASAEFTASVIRTFEDAGVIWHMAELGKVDQGGGGTIAQYVANLNVDVIDVGVPVLSMHAPFEIVSKFDVYETYRSFAAFFNARA